VPALASSADAVPAPVPAEQAAARPVSAMPNQVVMPVIGEEFLFRFDAPLRAQLDAVTAGGQAARVLFPVSEGRVLDLGITRHDIRTDKQGELYGLVDDTQYADAVLAYVDEAVAGTIVTPDGELFQVRYIGNGVHRVLQLDPNRMPDEGEPLKAGVARAESGPHPVMAGDQMGDAGNAPAPVLPAGLPTGETGEYVPPVAEDAIDPQIKDGEPMTVDVMIAYTAQSRINNGGLTGINALINAAVAKANLAYRNSLVPLYLRVVSTVETGYTASGSLGTDLGRLQSPSDHYMDSLYAQRNASNADMVSLFVSTGDAAGLAYLLNPEASVKGHSDWTFSVMVDSAADSNITYAHEIGHNFGCGHGMENGGGVFSFAGGYRFFTGQWYRTVMAYAPGVRIPWFSNPAVGYLGAPTGTSSSANNALALVRGKKNNASLRFGYSDFSVAATIDVNGDNNPDLIRRNIYTGEVDIVTMVGVVQQGPSSVMQTAGTLWAPALSADFNADGKPDIMWRNISTGDISVWFLNGTTRASSMRFWAPTNAAMAEWMPMLAGDFNHDTNPDVVMRNTRTGQVMVWYLNGTTKIGEAQLHGTTDPTWVPFTAADLNGDSKPDIVWRNSATGKMKIVHYDNLVNIGARILLDPVNADQKAWRVMTAGDFNGDGKEDLVWRNTDSGRVKVFYMDNGVNTGVGWISQ
jgi:hypothetical protein